MVKYGNNVFGYVRAHAAPYRATPQDTPHVQEHYGHADDGTLMTCMMTWDAQGKDLMGKIHDAIMAN